MPDPTVDGIMELVKKYGRHVENAQFLSAQFAKGIGDYATQRLEEKAAEDMLPRIRAAVESMAPTWRPIAEAPKDGTVVWGWRPEWTTPRLVQFYHANLHSSWRSHETGNYMISDPPTHYIPLPAPPKEGE